jgi:hypothetical protein
MAKITALPVAGALDGTEHLPVVQGANTKRATLAAFRDLIIPFVQNYYKGDKGDTGASENTYNSYAALQASDPTRDSARLVGDIDVPPRPDGPYNNPTRTIGGWVPQGAAGIVFGDRTVEDRLLETVSLKDTRFAGGCKGDGVSDDTAAFQAAVDDLAARNGGKIIMPPGDYVTGTIYFPYERSIIVEGCGPVASRWVMLSPTQPVARVPRTTSNSRNHGCQFRNFGIVAHRLCRPTNNKHIAFDAIGFNDVKFDNIRYFDNAGGSVGILFYTAAGPQLTYNQYFRNISSFQNYGPGYVIKTGFDADPDAVAGPTSYLTNTNLLHVDGFWVYANVGMKSAFDLSCCTNYTVRHGLIESVDGDGIILGAAGVVETCWLESIGGDYIHFQNNRGSVVSSGNRLSTIMLSGISGTTHIPLDCSNNIIENTYGNDFQVSRADHFAGNIISNSQALGGKPTMTKAFGSGNSDLNIVEVPDTAVMVSRIDGMWNIVFRFKPATVGRHGLNINPPSGYANKRLQAACYDPANGAGYMTNVISRSQIYVDCTSTAPVDVFVQVAYE